MNSWIDIRRFPELEANLSDLDVKLDVLRKACDEAVDPDQLGLFDDIEDLVGLGFLHCQLYMVRRRGDVPDKASAYTYGARFRSHPYAAVINAAANFWKHRDEWPDVLTGREQRIVDIFVDAGLSQSEYQLTNLLCALERSNRLVGLLPHVVNWRDAFDRRDTLTGEAGRGAQRGR